MSRIGRLSLCLLAGLCLAGCRASQPAASAAPPAAGPPPAILVSVAPARLVTVADTTTYVASIQSLDSMVISPLVGGIITRIPVRSGEAVAAGAELVDLDPAVQAAAVHNIEASRAAQQATIVYDKQQLERIGALFQAKIETQQDLQAAQSTYDNAVGQLAAIEAQLRQQQVLLGYYTVTAPRAGVVGDIPVKVGDQVMTTTQLTTLDQSSGLEVYVQVPIERAAQLKVGLPLAVLDSQGQTVAETTVRFVSPQVDNQTQSILLKADVADPRLRAQQFVQARITWGSHAAMQAPVLSVSDINGKYFVYVAAPVTGHPGAFAARQTPVAVGPITGNNYEIESGLNPGDLLIVSTTQILADGMPVLPLPGTATPVGGRAGGR